MSCRAYPRRDRTICLGASGSVCHALRSGFQWVQCSLKEEREIVISSRPLKASAFQIENIRMAFVFEY
jgi:hypothetical protein